MRSGETLSAIPSRTARRTGVWVIRRTRSLAEIILNTARGFQADRGFDLAASLAFATLVAAVVLAHVGRVLARKAATPGAKRARLMICFGLATLLMIAGTPWPGTRAGRPFFRV